MARRKFLQKNEQQIKNNISIFVTIHYILRLRAMYSYDSDIFLCENIQII